MAGASGEGGGSQRLRDVHQGLPASGVQRGSVHMVEGSYDYHHYMQASTIFAAFTGSCWANTKAAAAQVALAILRLT